jgi:hypothetical protein
MATMTTEGDGPPAASGGGLAWADEDDEGSALEGPRLEGRLAAVAAGLDAAGGVEAASLSEAGLRAGLDEVWRIRARVDELLCRLVADADARGIPVDDGASSTRSWLAWRFKMSRGAAGGIVAQLPAMSPRVSATRRAWADGAVSGEQAGLIAATIDGLGVDIDEQACRRAEAVLVEQAGRLTYPQLRICANRVIEVVDPDGADARIEAFLQAEQDRAVWATVLRRYRRGDGTSTLTGRLPDLHADMLYRVLDVLAAPRRSGAVLTGPAAGTGAGAAIDVDGDHGDAEVGVLTGPQRHGRALCELIEHLPTDALPGHGTVNTTVVVTVDNDRLTSGLGEAMLDTGGRISAGQARRLACNAAIVPMVLAGDSAILDLGTSRRLFDRHQRIALTVRDRGCIWPSCDRPPAWTEAHHITAWSAGGPTNLSNGCLLCSFHHHLLHQGEWAVRIAPDGIPDVIPPTRIDPDQRPLRHPRFQPPPSRPEGPAP